MPPRKDGCLKYGRKKNLVFNGTLQWAGRANTGKTATMTITIDLDDLLRIMKFANRTALQPDDDDKNAWERTCQLLLAAGMEPHEITQRIAPMPRSKEAHR